MKQGLRQLRMMEAVHAVVVSVRRPNATQWLTEISTRPGDLAQYEVTIDNAGIRHSATSWW